MTVLARAPFGRWYVSAVRLGIVSSVCTTPAVAQTPPGQFAPSLQITDRLSATQLISQCFVTRNRRASIAYAVAVDREQMDSAWNRLRPTAINCLHSGSLTMQPLELQGAIGEALLRDDGGADLKRVAALKPVPAIRLTAITNPKNPTGLFACVADANPAGVSAVLGTVAGSAEETAAVRALVRVMRACIPEHTELHIGPSKVRVLVALALFRLASASAEAR